MVLRTSGNISGGLEGDLVPSNYVTLTEKAGYKGMRNYYLVGTELLFAVTKKKSGGR